MSLIPVRGKSSTFYTETVLSFIGTRLWLGGEGLVRPPLAARCSGGQTKRRKDGEPCSGALPILKGKMGTEDGRVVSASRVQGKYSSKRKTRRISVPRLTDKQLEQLLNSRKTQPNETLKPSTPRIAGCSCPPKFRIFDPELKVEICTIHGMEPALKFQSADIVTGPEKFNRQPDNAAVFRHNRGSTTLSPHERGRKIPEKHHLTALTSMYGKRDGSIPGSQKQIKTCPSCREQQVVEVFGSTLKCGNPGCGVKLGHYTLIWQPYVPEDPAHNGTSNPAMLFWNDKNRLANWDPPEDDALLKVGLELFGQQVAGKYSDVEASELGVHFRRGLKAINKKLRCDVQALLDMTIEKYGKVVVPVNPLQARNRLPEDFQFSENVEEF